MKLSVPYLQWRDGRPRWEPGPKLREKGFKGQDLKDGQGNWLNQPDAIAAAEQLNIGTKAARASKQAPRLQRGVPILSVIWHDMKRTPEYRLTTSGKPKSPKTLSDYDNKAQVFLQWAGDMPITSLTRKLIKDFWRILYKTRGHAMANGVVAVLRLTLEYAVNEELLAANPASKLKLPKVVERVVTYTPEETAHIAAVGDAMGEHGLVDAIFVALATGQRQGDILVAPWSLFEGGRIRNLKQAKTDSIVGFPQTRVLKKRLAEIRMRQAVAKARLIAQKPNGYVEFTHVVIDDRTDAPFKNVMFKHRHTALIRAAAKQWHDAGRVKDAATLYGKTFLDYRDTALTRLYLGGATVLEIASVSGHDPETVHKTLKHYIALNEADGKRAMKSMDAYMKAEGIKV